MTLRCWEDMEKIKNIIVWDFLEAFQCLKCQDQAKVKGPAKVRGPVVETKKEICRLT